MVGVQARVWAVEGWECDGHFSKIQDHWRKVATHNAEVPGWVREVVDQLPVDATSRVHLPVESVVRSSWVLVAHLRLGTGEGGAAEPVAPPLAIDLLEHLACWLWVIHLQATPRGPYQALLTEASELRETLRSEVEGLARTGRTRRNVLTVLGTRKNYRTVARDLGLLQQVLNGVEVECRMGPAALRRASTLANRLFEIDAARRSDRDSPYKKNLRHRVFTLVVRHFQEFRRQLKLRDSTVAQQIPSLYEMRSRRCRAARLRTPKSA